MADFYKTKEVGELLKFRKILLIGDSNVRPLYKDLLGALNQKRLTSIDMLKNPDVASYFGDVAIQQYGKKNTWAFWENRIYEEGGCRVEMFSTGQIVVDVIQGFFRKLLEKSSVPEIVYLSYGPTHWKNRRHLLFDLLAELKFTFPWTTVFIVGSGFRTTTDSFGDPIFDDVPYFTKCNHSVDEQNNKAIVDKISPMGFIFLNNSSYLRNGIFRGVAGQPGWESVVVRYTTLLFLTCLARNLLIKTPGRVNQDILIKAIATNNREDLEEYSVLLKKISNWTVLKTTAPVDRGADPAATNAKEILEKLWKLYRRSRNRGSKSGLDMKNRRKKSSDLYNALSSNSNGGEDDRNQDVAGADTEPTVRLRVIDKDPSQISNDLEEGELDADSLEEGEIREPPSPPRPRSPTGGSPYHQLLSDISSSEGDIDDEDDAEFVAPDTATPLIQIQRNLTIQNASASTHIEPSLGMPSTSSRCPKTIIIEISDEETPAEGEEAVMTYTSPEDVIINLESSDSDVEAITASKEMIPNNSLSQTARKPKVCEKQNQQKFASKNVNSDLYLKNEKGDVIPWPVDFGIVGGDPLWKWWRTHIEENNHSITICPKDWPQVHAQIPSLFTKGNMAVPKIIDDVNMFLETLKEVQFSEDCLVDCSYNILEDVDEDQNAHVAETVPEMSRISEKRVQFQIPPKGAAKSSLPAAHISVSSFASYRQLMSRHSTVPSNSKTTTTKQAPTSGAKVQPSSRSSSSQYNAYGENIGLPKATSPTRHWHPLCSWVPTPSKSVRHSSGSHHDRTGGSCYVQQEYPKKSAGDRKRKRTRSRSRSPLGRDYSPLSNARRRSSSVTRKEISRRSCPEKKSKTSSKR